jgi:hypothetical protein
MEATAIYDWLMDGVCDTIRDPFDAHVLASVLAVAISETKARGVCLSEGTGLPAATHVSIMKMAFPHALPLLDLHAESTDLKVPDDERCLRDLLTRAATQRTPFQIHLAAIIARRSTQSPVAGSGSPQSRRVVGSDEQAFRASCQPQHQQHEVEEILLPDDLPGRGIPPVYCAQLRGVR